MRPKTLLFTSGLALALLAFILFVERDLPTTDQRQASDRKVLGLEADAVLALELRLGERDVRLAKGDGDEWRLERPLEARADAAAVRGLVDRLTGLEKERTVEAVDRAAAGLDAPRATIKLVTADRETVLEIGPELPASDAMLVALAGGRDAYQVAGDLYATLERAPGEWRDKALFPHSRGDIERLRLSRPDRPEVVLARRDDRWLLEAPLVDRADEDAVEGLLTQISGLRAARFVDPAPDAPVDQAALGLDPAWATVIVEARDVPAPFVIEVGRVVGDDGSIEAGPIPATAPEDGLEETGQEGGGERYLRIGTQVVSASADLAAAAARSPRAWRSRAWTDWQVFEVQTATVRDTGGSLELRRADSEWLRDGEPVDYASASDLLYAVTEVRAEAVLDRDDAGAGPLGEPAVELTFTREDGGSERLTLFPGDQTVAFATTDGREAVLRVPAITLAEVAEKLRAVREATVPDAAAAEPEEGGDEGASEATGSGSSGEGG